MYFCHCPGVWFWLWDVAADELACPELLNMHKNGENTGCPAVDKGDAARLERSRADATIRLGTERLHDP